MRPAVSPGHVEAADGRWLTDSTTTTEPVAIIGMGCRMAAGVDSPEALWSFLLNEGDAAGPLPAGRWDDYAELSPEQATSLRETVTAGSFMADVAGFDAGFFGISPREAQLIDPQQRLALEVCWEALENAGVPAHSLADTDSGVFMGVGSNDYGRKLLEDTPRVEAWTGIGAALCGVANRVSYTLNLHGTSVAIDTACSSSSVAIHDACNALRLGEIPLALAGGVLTITGPGQSVALAAAGAISEDGRSKPFDAAADGYGRGEGVGVLVLKRLGDAQRAGDRVLAVILGSAVAQDGRTEGIMAPSQEAQQRLLRHAYARAGVDPATVDYVEAHGTGTPVGDPIEARALAAVLGRDRSPDRPCLIGSVKSNVGHLEAAAGVAGVLKAVLAIRHGVIPPTRATRGPNPAIAWGENGLRLANRVTDWPRTDHPRRAGVASYGYGGTIAHIVLQEPPAADEPAPSDADVGDALLPFPLSGATDEGLRANAERLAGWLDTHPQVRPADVGHTLALRRSHLPARAVVTATGIAELAERMRDLGDGGRAEGVVTGERVPELAGQDPVWVFSGHGAQWVGMGRELLADEPAFGAVMDELTPVLTAQFGLGPRDLLCGEPDGTDQVQLAIFTVQVGLAAVWRANGVRPGAVIGHSVGEIAAAVAAGALDLADGARLACRRSALLRDVSGCGAMAMVALPHDQVATLLDGRDDVTAGVWAAPSSTVVSGSKEAVAELAKGWADEERAVRRVDSDVAFHSAQMAPLAAALRAATADLRPRQPEIPLYSTALPDPRDPAPRDADYWATNLRDPVRFADAVTAAAEDGHRVFLEISAHPVVTYSMEETLEAAGVDARLIVATLRRDRPEVPTLLANLAALHCGGANIDWSARHGRGTLCDLPTTAFQHEGHWVELATPAAGGRGHVPETHTLLGGRSTVQGTSPARIWRTRLERANRPYPGDHPLDGAEIVPAAVLLNTFFDAVRAEDGGAAALRDVALSVPVAANQTRDVQVVLQDGLLRLSSRVVTGDDPAADDDWLTHTTAHAAPDLAAVAAADRCDPDDRTGEPMSPSFVTDTLADLGVAAMGLPWRLLDLRGGDGRLRAKVTTEPADSGPSWANVLDAATSAASVSFPGEPVLRMPARVAEAWVVGPPPEHAVLLVRPATGGDVVDVDIIGQDGTGCARLAGLRFGNPQGDLSTVRPAELLYRTDWRPHEPPDAKPEHDASLGTVVLVGRDDADDDGLRAAMRRQARAVSCVAGPEELAGLTERLDPPYTVVLCGAAVARASSPAGAATRGVTLFRRLAAELASWPKDDTTLWCLTTGARAAATEDGLVQTPLWGFGRVAATELSAIWGGIVDLPEHPGPTDLDQFVRLLLAGPAGQDVLAVEAGEVRTSRLVPAPVSPAGNGVTGRADGTYLITGGLGALGLRVADWLVSRGARRLVLLGRTVPPPRREWERVGDQETLDRIGAIRALEAAGATVRCVAADVANPERLRAALDPAELDLPPIRGVVHAAGTVDNRLVPDLDDEGIKAVMAGKAGGALVLHELFPPGRLDFFVLFSSAGQLLNVQGQAGYAASNAFLDGLARHRRSAGSPDTIALAWTSWRGLGLSVSSATAAAELTARGTDDITAEEALMAWERVDLVEDANIAVLRVRRAALRGSEPVLLRDLRLEETVTEQAAIWSTPVGPELLRRLHDEVRAAAATALNIAPEKLSDTQPLREQGIDSVLAVTVRQQLEERLNVGLPQTLMWEHPTTAAIAEYLLQTHGRPAEAS